ncbi:DUF3939 domain-containing protein [Clostridium ganghwense]|uniref:DUF3939 domain-containing protein n=1 Tax=Clostridium ganghwense TaxID=312089 RepID=A0ABT4CUM7_9CLOT|nr:DUF3939 domain-containing protein [Clostridium ganghwense]MCY6372780.1 DUF3939 domain-containing protein [Clostridium ganghwense]
MNKKILTLVSCIIIILLVINYNPKLKCRLYLMSKGYKILSQEDKDYPNFLKTTDKCTIHYTYKLTKESICKNLNYRSWAVQKVEAKKYLGKTIHIYIFVVKNHPLEEKFKDENVTSVGIDIIVVNNKIIGGTSNALYDNDHMKMGGGPYSLDGKTPQEINEMDYTQWLNNFKSTIN